MPPLFSFNSKGACENCQGLGVIYTDLAVLDEVKTPCEVCGGKRFKDEVLAYKLNGKAISDVLSMTVGQALAHFPKSTVTAKLQALNDVGLGLSEPWVSRSARSRAANASASSWPASCTRKAASM